MIRAKGDDGTSPRLRARWLLRDDRDEEGAAERDAARRVGVVAVAILARNGV